MSDREPSITPTEGASERSRRENAWRHRAEAAERQVSGLEEQLISRSPVDRAIGLLMGVFGLEAEAATEVLAWVSDRAAEELPATAERLLVAVRTTGSGELVVDQLTHVLADLARGDGDVR